MSEHEPIVEIAKCLVRVELVKKNYSFEEIAAYPLHAVPVIMTQHDCWYKDHWRFSTVFARVTGVIDTWRRQYPMQTLHLRSNGFCFFTTDLNEAIDGLHI